MDANIREASPSEAEQLTKLALRSKGHWGYDQKFLEDSRIDLTLTAQYISSCPTFVIEEQGSIEGFYSLRGEGSEVELMHLFVEPAMIGRGFGRLLFRHAVETARRLKFKRLLISSDPFALEFYETMGARRVGEIASPVRPGRMLPLLHYTLLSSLEDKKPKEDSSHALR
ncbi:MAG: GNAT family N-acetyltransferase [Acidobacteria bacterium]|nr:GNAT family N-acetyltransferase [Acidobacteriota bacterium]